jgi:energy-dependent translational throttle protein EttA
MVPQEPMLDPDKTVRETLEEAFADTVALLKEFEDITARMGEPMSTTTK